MPYARSACPRPERGRQDLEVLKNPKFARRLAGGRKGAQPHRTSSECGGNLQGQGTPRHDPRRRGPRHRMRPSRIPIPCLAQSLVGGPDIVARPAGSPPKPSTCRGPERPARRSGATGPRAPAPSPAPSLQPRRPRQARRLSRLPEPTAAASPPHSRSVRRDRLDGRVVADHPNRTLPHLRRVPCRRRPHGSVLSQSGASGKPGGGSGR